MFCCCNWLQTNHMGMKWNKSHHFKSQFLLVDIILCCAVSVFVSPSFFATYYCMRYSVCAFFCVLLPLFLLISIQIWYKPHLTYLLIMNDRTYRFLFWFLFFSLFLRWDRLTLNCEHHKVYGCETLQTQATTEIKESKNKKSNWKYLLVKSNEKTASRRTKKKYSPSMWDCFQFCYGVRVRIFCVGEFSV